MIISLDPDQTSIKSASDPDACCLADLTKFEVNRMRLKNEADES
jgi:hypothetical protein